MSTTDNSFIDFSAEPVQGRVPARFHIESKHPLPPNVMGEVNQAFQMFKRRMSLSLLTTDVHRQVLPSGARVRFTSTAGLDSIYVYYDKERLEECHLLLDSGVVDMLAVRGSSPDVRSAGKLYRTYSVHTYINSLDGGPGVIGIIKVPPVAGKPPLDGATAKSFPAGPETAKLVAAEVPPSIFTGKTRLWVQAMYGAHPLMRERYEAHAGAALPYLTVNGVDVTTSCGVYLDPVTCRHWLLSIVTGGVMCYPMISNSCGEKLRRKLADPEVTSASKRRIEAYILAYSLPLEADAQSIFVHIPATESMGYGWHFNMSGTAADICAHVINLHDTESTHYRLLFTRTDVWSATLEVVSGPSRWWANRTMNVFAYPIWALSALMKLGPATGASGPFGSAHIYAFYKGDECIVTSVDIATEAAYGERKSSPEGYAGRVYGESPRLLTIGGDNAEYTDYGTHDVVIANVTVGGTSIGGVQRYKPTVGAGIKKSVGVPIDPATYHHGAMAVSWFVGRPAYVGVDSSGQYIPNSAAGWEIKEHDFSPPPHGSSDPVYGTFWNNVSGTFTKYSFIGAEWEYNSTACIIPMYDAEAVYAYKKRRKGSNRTYSNAYYSSGMGAWIGRQGWAVGNVVSLLDTYEDLSAGPVASADYSDSSTEATNDDAEHANLVWRGDTASFKMKAAGPFFDPLSPLIEQQFDTRSTASTGTDAAVYCAWAEVKAGFHTTDPDSMGPFVFTGWA